MNNPLKITKQDSEHGGRYITTLEGHEAVITYSKIGNNVFVADHTGVPSAIGGRGVALALTKFMIEDARASGFKVVPACSYTAAQFRRHPEWADVLAASKRS